MRMWLETFCSSISKDEWNEYMKGTHSCSGRLLRKKIKEHIPQLYHDLCLDYYNPWEDQARKKDGLYVYVHSAIEYFIRYE